MQDTLYISQRCNNLFFFTHHSRAWHCMYRHTIHIYYETNVKGLQYKYGPKCRLQPLKHNQKYEYKQYEWGDRCELTIVLCPLCEQVLAVLALQTQTADRSYDQSRAKFPSELIHNRYFHLPNYIPALFWKRQKQVGINLACVMSFSQLSQQSFPIVAL